MKRRLYVISSSLGLVKVGVSASPVGRTIDLQHNRDDKLELAWQSEPLDDGNVAIERYAHKLLKEYRKKGEWFSCKIKVAIVACNQAIAECKPKPKDGFTRLSISILPEDNAKILALKSSLEAETGKRHSLSKVVRIAIDAICEREGVK